jgi:hypothetical protein
MQLEPVSNYHQTLADSLVISNILYHLKTLELRPLC